MISSSHSLAWCPTQTIKSLNAANIIAGRAASGQIENMQSQTQIHSPIHQYRYKSTYFAVNSMPCQTEVLAEIISGNKCQTLQTDFHVSGGATLLNALHTYLICDSSFEMTSLTIVIKWLFRDWWLKPRRMTSPITPGDDIFCDIWEIVIDQAKNVWVIVMSFPAHQMVW